MEPQKGFTIVEIIMITVGIAILATITLVSFGSWQEDVQTTVVRHDMSNLATALENYRNFNNAYPTALSSVSQSFTVSNDVTVNVATLTTSGYCIEGRSNNMPSVIYSIRSSNHTPTAGVCP